MIGQVIFAKIAVPSALVLGTAKKTSSSASGIIIIALIFGALYMLFLRPQRNRMRLQQRQQSSAEVGDEIVTSSGIVGRVLAFEGDRVEVEIAEGTSIWIVRQAIGRRVTPPLSTETSDDSDRDDTDTDDDSNGDADGNDGVDESPTPPGAGTSS